MKKISVRNLIEFVYLSGNLDFTIQKRNRAVEGIAGHRTLQKKYCVNENYKKEVRLEYLFNYKGIDFNVNGIADGILYSKEIDTIDEIKTTYSNEIIDNAIHFAQVKCYGYIFLENEKKEKINIQLIYFNIKTKNEKKIIRTYSYKELKSFFFGIIEQFYLWVKFEKKEYEKKILSINKLKFPFVNYRKGQREFSIAVYRNNREGEKFFTQAPTGIGKTMGVIFPSLKNYYNGDIDRIFYLTGKTITKIAAEDSFKILLNNGLKFKVITITAKDKICFEKDINCSIENCIYAEGFYDRLKDGLLDILSNENLLNRKIVSKYAKKHKLCPFEFSLEISLWCDCIICDYNYLFDPKVYLRRFFQYKKGKYLFLVDEAHNLVDRARNMYSAELYKDKFLNIRRLLKEEKQSKLYKILTKINIYFLNIKKKCIDNFYYQETELEKFNSFLVEFIEIIEEMIEKKIIRKYSFEIVEVFFSVLDYLRIAKIYNKSREQSIKKKEKNEYSGSYVTYVEKVKRKVKIKLLCIDPSENLSKILKKGEASVFFSATLTPLEYFQNILGGDEKDNKLKLLSPFNINNRELIIMKNISTKYRDRDKSYLPIVEAIEKTGSIKEGNYIVYFPSYKYLEEVVNIYKKRNPEKEILIQSKEMTEEERETFVLKFKKGKNITGFSVIGGVFSESIDLKGDALIGVLIVGVGLPKICNELNIIKNYFDKNKTNSEFQNLKGFNYAYKFPGFNKVLQAAGRLIRTESDKGIIILIAERFSHFSYKKLFPKDWNSHKEIELPNSLTKTLKKFWNKS